MVKTLFQSFGVVAAILVMVAATIVSMYISYLLGIAVVVSLLVFVTYHVLATIQTGK